MDLKLLNVMRFFTMSTFTEHETKCSPNMHVLNATPNATKAGLPFSQNRNKPILFLYRTELQNYKRSILSRVCLATAYPEINISYPVDYSFWLHAVVFTCENGIQLAGLIIISEGRSRSMKLYFIPWSGRRIFQGSL